MSIGQRGKKPADSQTEQSEGGNFVRLLDGLLQVPRSDIERQLQDEKDAKAAKKIKAASSRAGAARKR